jgi:MOSC domain-containing protein YiiM
MRANKGKVVSLHLGDEGVLEKAGCTEVEVALDGFVGDRHRGLDRETWAGDKQPEGTVRRNERQWSAVAQEELVTISQGMGLDSTLSAADVGANLCLSGIPDFSRLPRGTLLRFEAGVALIVEEYNPPCADMGARLAKTQRSRSGEPLADTAFSQASKFCRGIVGVVEVGGKISVGESVEVVPERLPKWLRKPI